MSCFYHHDRTSVGGCKSCGKNLCPECAIDLGKVILLGACFLVYGAFGLLQARRLGKRADDT